MREMIFNSRVATVRLVLGTAWALNGLCASGSGESINSPLNGNPDLLFLAFLENSKENHQKGKDFFGLPNS